MKKNSSTDFTLWFSIGFFSKKLSYIHTYDNEGNYEKIKGSKIKYDDGGLHVKRNDSK